MTGARSLLASHLNTNFECSMRLTLPVAEFVRIQGPGYFLLAITALLFLPRYASAGMPSVSFTEVASLRMEVISFFLVVLLASAGIVQLIWNLLKRDFAWLPRLNYWRALGIVTLWGLLFVVVLTMISGARELMTPGAWVKTGATYKLKDDAAKEPGSPQPNDPALVARSFQILALSNALQQYAREHDGDLPTADEAKKAIPAVRWDLPGFTGTTYIYVPNSEAAIGNTIVAHEPHIFPGDVLAITADGRLVQSPFEDLLTRVRSERNAASPPAQAAETASEAEASP
jgi:hypothetical protein